MEKQKLLIRKVYLQRGILYDGDWEKVEAEQAVKDERQSRQRKQSKLDFGKTRNMTPKKLQKAKRDPKALIQKFQNDACRLPATPEFARKLTKLMREQAVDSPPPTAVVLQSLIEAHEKSGNDATRSSSYRLWLLTEEERAGEMRDDDAEDEDGSDIQDDSETSDVESSESDNESDSEEDGGAGGSNEQEADDEDEVGVGIEHYEPEFVDEGSEGGVGEEERSGDRQDAGSEGMGGTEDNRTQLNESSQGSLGSGTTPRRSWAHDAIFKIYKRRIPW